MLCSKRFLRLAGLVGWLGWLGRLPGLAGLAGLAGGTGGTPAGGRLAAGCRMASIVLGRCWGRSLSGGS